MLGTGTELFIGGKNLQEALSAISVGRQDSAGWMLHQYSSSIQKMSQSISAAAVTMQTAFGFSYIAL